MADKEKPLDEAPRSGGLYRVGDKVVDAQGKDLGDEGHALAEKHESKAKAKAEAEAEKAKQLQAQVAAGGLLPALQTLAAAAAAPVTKPSKKGANKAPEAPAVEETTKSGVEVEETTKSGVEVEE